MNMKYNTLLEAQMGEYPDSVVLSDVQMLNALRMQIPDWLDNHKYEDWIWYDARHEIND